jgi:lipoprotein-anchoring transpeptidase ErfK/SrfK
MVFRLVLTSAAVLGLSFAADSNSLPFDVDAVNDPRTLDIVGPRFGGPAALRAQILLGRAHFSPAEIDALYGNNLRSALFGFQSSRKLPMTGIVDEATWQTLDLDKEPPLIPHTITADEVRGPFVQIPASMSARAKLPCSCYGNAAEEMGERYHINPKLLARINPGKDITRQGEQILVPNVLVEFKPPMAAAVVVSKSNQAATAFRADGSIIAQYPATMGSEHDPLPIGVWEIVQVVRNPWYNYNPKLFWDANPNDARARIPPGPNSPVGVVWMGLNKRHYGIHGTPAPNRIGHAESHGCIRLTNWDALELSRMVHKGTLANLTE